MTKDSTLIVQCTVCETYHDILVDQADIDAYYAGALAQNAFPYLTADERELIISGVCGPCYDHITNYR